MWPLWMPPLQSGMPTVCATNTNKTMAPRTALRGIFTGLSVSKFPAVDADVVDLSSKVCEIARTKERSGSAQVAY